MRIAEIITELCFLNFAVMFLYSAVSEEPQRFRLESREKLLILAPHQDDDVIMAGGLGIQNQKLGGSTRVVFLTRAESNEEAAIRKAEATKAWSALGPVSFEYLDFVSKDAWSDEERNAARRKITESIRRFGPSLVIAPVEELGNPEHDLLSALARGISTDFPLVRFWYAAEYNPVYEAELHPGKLFWLIVRLLPFVPYREPNYGLHPGFQRELNMNSEELDQKKQMLLSYESQRSVIPLEQFGYADLFDSSRLYSGKLVKVHGKYLSVWSLMTLGILASALVSGGLLFAVCRGKKTMAAVAAAATGGLLAVRASEPILFREEFLLVALFVLGLWLGVLAQFRRKQF